MIYDGFMIGLSWFMAWVYDRFIMIYDGFMIGLS